MGSGSLKALLAVLAVAGYQNRDKIGELIKRASEGGGLPFPGGGPDGAGTEDAARQPGGTAFPGPGSGSASADPLGAGFPGQSSASPSASGQSMSGLDDLLGGLLGGLGGSSGGGSPNGGGLGGGGLGGGLGGLLGGAGLGTLLNGGLSDLIDQFRQAGQAGKADSWVGTGANEPIDDSELQQALGPDVLREVAEKTGLSEEEVLARLAKSLPDAVDGLTPSGLMPQSRSGY